MPWKQGNAWTNQFGYTENQIWAQIRREDLPTSIYKNHRQRQGVNDGMNQLLQTQMGLWSRPTGPDHSDPPLNASPRDA